MAHLAAGCSSLAVFRCYLQFHMSINVTKTESLTEMLLQGGGKGEDGEDPDYLGPTDFVYVELYRAKKGTVPEIIGAESRAEIGASDILNDAMARLKNAAISEEEFLQYMHSRGGQEAAQV